MVYNNLLYIGCLLLMLTLWYRLLFYNPNTQNPIQWGNQNIRPHICMLEIQRRCYRNMFWLLKLHNLDNQGVIANWYHWCSLYILCSPEYMYMDHHSQIYNHLHIHIYNLCNSHFVHLVNNKDMDFLHCHSILYFVHNDNEFRLADKIGRASCRERV